MKGLLAYYVGNKIEAESILEKAILCNDQSNIVWHIRGIIEKENLYFIV